MASLITQENVEAALKVCEAPRQREFAEAYLELKNQYKVAEKFGITQSCVHKALLRMVKSASKKGVQPSADINKQLPYGHVAKGYSTAYNRNGDMIMQWVKTKADDKLIHEAFVEYIEGLCKELPAFPKTPKPKGILNENLVNLHTFTDYHMGMLAWEGEGGEDWDMEIAESTLIKAFGHMIHNAPDAHTGIIANLGDFLHSDSMKSLTPRSGHVLDQSAVYAQIIDAAISAFTTLIHMALKKYEEVVVVMAMGNHDETGSLWLQKMFSQLYKRESRVKIVTNNLPFYSYVHGDCSLFWHHGDRVKIPQMPLLFAAEFPKDWGNTKYRFGHCGHMHHNHVKEYNGMIVEQHNTLAARDSHSSHGGYHSLRRASTITYHKNFGEVSRIFVSPEMLS